MREVLEFGATDLEQIGVSGEPEHKQPESTFWQVSQARLYREGICNMDMIGKLPCEELIGFKMNLIIQTSCLNVSGYEGAQSPPRNSH